MSLLFNYMCCGTRQYRGIDLSMHPSIIPRLRFVVNRRVFGRFFSNTLVRRAAVTSLAKPLLLPFRFDCGTLRHTYSANRMASTCPSMKTPEKFQRLPDYAKPIHYDIRLSPDLERFVFDGRVVVDVEVLKNASELKLHAQTLHIASAEIKLADGSVHDMLDFDYDPKWSILTVKLPHTIGPQKVHLTIDFSGELNDKMHGFYRSCYKSADGQDKYLAATQFESTYARYSFPCWDEPIYKASFDVTLDVNPQLTALSNMNIISETLKADGKKKTVKFATSPHMSSYLVAFAVGEFEYLESKTDSGCPVRVYTVPGKKDLGKFSLELATKAINWYDNWFGIKYALPKCDLIAIPDFSMGAMENWGLVTYREVALLVDEAKSSTRQKSRVALIVAHELAHFWFGDLVTMKWWTDLWLKEGFASFMEYLFVGYNYPEFKIWLHFLNDELASGFQLDALRSSHPIEVEIDNPNELDEIYDSITYAKSNSVNRMLCYYLGEPIFQKGLQIYLKRFQYSNAVTNDLWDALSEASGQNVTELMSGWTKQMGYPLVSVTQRQDGKNRILTLTQRRFIADGGEDEKKQLWQVPITISVGSNPSEVKAKFLLKERQQEFVVENVPEGEWVKLNAGTTGFYRVSYSDDMLSALLPVIANKQLPVLDRFGITNDMFALVESGSVLAPKFLSLLEASVNEDEYNVWEALDSGVAQLAMVLEHADQDGTLKKRLYSYIAKILAPVGDKLGWEVQSGEDSQRTMLRSLIHSRLAKAGHTPAIEKAASLFAEHVETKKELHPDLRLAIYGSAARNGGEVAFNQLVNIFESVGFSEVERQALVALSQTQDRQLLDRLFKYGFEDGKVRSQDLMLLLLGPGGNRVGQNYMWPYFKEHLQLFLNKFGNANAALFQRCLKMSVENHCCENVAKDVETFFCGKMDETSVQTLDRPIRQITESIRLNKALLDKNAIVVDEFLSSKGC